MCSLSLSKLDSNVLFSSAGDNKIVAWKYQKGSAIATFDLDSVMENENIKTGDIIPKQIVNWKTEERAEVLAIVFDRQVT